MARPEKVAVVDEIKERLTAAEAVFITAMDSNPLAADPSALVDRHRDDIHAGIPVLGQLLEGPVYFCCSPAAATEGIAPLADDRLQVVEFSGPHPAGLPGTHRRSWT